MVPATCVPWPSQSTVVLEPRMVLVPGFSRVPNSLWGATPVSMT